MEQLPSSAPPTTKKSGSKKSKKGWRRRTDIKDIEEHVEEQRAEERQGGIVGEKTDASLFFVDAKITEPETADKKKKLEIVSDDDDEEVHVSRRDKMMKRLVTEEKKTSSDSAPVVNIWGQPVISVKNDYLASTEPFVKKMPVTVKRKIPVVAEAVECDHPGASYNPSYESHQELLRIAHEREMGKIKRRKILNKQVKLVSVGQLKKLSKEWLKEMSQGLNNDTSIAAADDDDEVSCAGNRPVSADDKKTLKERRKMLQSREAQRKLLLEKRARRKLQDVYRLKTLKKEINAEERRKAEKKERMKLRMEAKNSGTKRLSKHKFESGDPVVQLSEELSGSLRGLQVEGSVIKDRFQSLQKRNVIETRKPVVPKRKYKQKSYEKRSYRSKTGFKVYKREM